jgi:1-acyl-sn-glycerol-3-phosphate acyltransferase
MNAGFVRFLSWDGGAARLIPTGGQIRVVGARYGFWPLLLQGLIGPPMLKQGLDYVLSVVYLLYFGLVLVVFEGIQRLAFTVFGPRAQARTADWLNAAIAYGWLLTGSHIHFRQTAELPPNRPIIFVANHQSMFDISPIGWFLRQYRPIFVSKKELASGIPSISYNLHKSQSALIDRKDGKQAMLEIARLGTLIKANNFSAVIFPEGTRSPGGQLKPFAAGGVAILLKKAPNALIVPIAISGTGHFNPTSVFPLRSFTRMNWTVLPGIEPAGQPVEAVLEQARSRIAGELRMKNEE